VLSSPESGLRHAVELLSAVLSPTAGSLPPP